MKIVFTHNDFRAYFPPRLLALQVEFEKRGDELYIIELFEESIDYGFTTEDKSVFHHHEFLYKTYKGVSMLQIKKKLMTRLDEINPDVVLCWAIPFPAGAIAVKWANFKGKPVITMDDAQKDTFQRSKLNHFIKKRIFKHVDAFICPSDKWDETMIYWGFKKEQIFYGINAVDNNFWSQKSITNFIYENYFLTVGRQIPEKRHLDLLKAYKIYCDKQGVNAKSLILIGEGVERVKLEEYVKTNKLDRVIFIPFQKPAELRKYYHNALLFIMTSVSETFGLVVNEAMNGECPLILTNNVGCATTLIQEGRNGFIVNTGDIDKIAESLLKFDYLSIAEQKEMGKISKTIINDWGFEKLCTELFRAIDYVLKRKKNKSNIFDRLILYFWNGRI